MKISRTALYQSAHRETNGGKTDTQLKYRGLDGNYQINVNKISNRKVTETKGFQYSFRVLEYEFENGIP